MSENNTVRNLALRGLTDEETKAIEWARVRYGMATSTPAVKRCLIDAPGLVRERDHYRTLYNVLVNAVERIARIDETRANLAAERDLTIRKALKETREPY